MVSGLQSLIHFVYHGVPVAFLVFWLASAVVGCEDDEDSCSVGSERCECTKGGSCDTGLTCLSGKCVKAENGSSDDENDGNDVGKDNKDEEEDAAAATKSEDSGTVGEDERDAATATKSEDSGTAGDGEGDAAAESSGDSGTDSGAETNGLLDCTDGWCCYKDCFGKEHCGSPEYVPCSNDPGDLCGNSEAVYCKDDTALLPEWFSENDCLIFDYEGGSDVMYVALWYHCPVVEPESSDVDSVESNFIFEGEDLPCDFSSDPEPEWPAVDCNPSDAGTGS